MANFVFNIAKGRVVEYYQRVDGDDPLGSELVIVAIDANGETDANLIDMDNLNAILTGTANEVTNTNYARIDLTQANIGPFAPDDTNDRFDVDLPDQTWTSVATGDSWTDVLVCYDPTGSSTDSNIIPLTCHDFVVSPNGSNVVLQWHVDGVFRAS